MIWIFTISLATGQQGHREERHGKLQEKEYNISLERKLHLKREGDMGLRDWMKIEE